MNTTAIKKPPSKAIAITALKTALIVGSLLTLINHGPAIAQFSLSGEKQLQIALCYLMPFCVSSYSAWKTNR